MAQLKIRSRGEGVCAPVSSIAMIIKSLQQASILIKVAGLESWRTALYCSAPAGDILGSATRDQPSSLSCVMCGDDADQLEICAVLTSQGGSHAQEECLTILQLLGRVMELEAKREIDSAENVV